MKVRFLKDVTSPPCQAGKKDEIRDIERRIALMLIRSGHVEDAINPAPRPEPKPLNVLVSEPAEKTRNRKITKG